MKFSILATLSTASENNDDDDTDPDTEKNSPSRTSIDKGQELEGRRFERNNFPRDSGCFASSSPASDRSSQQSQSESGIHLPHDDDDIDIDEDHSSCDHEPQKRPAEKSAHTRNLRDRHTITTQDLDKLSLNSCAKDKDSFEALVEKYMSPKASLEVGHVSNARSIFEASKTNN